MPLAMTLLQRRTILVVALHLVLQLPGVATFRPVSLGRRRAAPLFAGGGFGKASGDDDGNGPYPKIAFPIDAAVEAAT